MHFYPSIVYQYKEKIKYGLGTNIWKLAITPCPSCSNLYFHLKYSNQWIGVSLVAQLLKNPPAMQETTVRFLGWEDPLEKGKATHSSILACTVHGVTESQTWLSDVSLSFSPAVGAQSLNHWATREAPSSSFLEPPAFTEGNLRAGIGLNLSLSPKANLNECSRIVEGTSDAKHWIRIRSGRITKTLSWRYARLIGHLIER